MMNQKFPSLLKTLKTKYSKINKDVFIEMVKNQRTDSETDSMLGLKDSENYDQKSDLSDSSHKGRKAEKESKSIENESGPPNVLSRFRYEENPMKR